MGRITPSFHGTKCRLLGGRVREGAQQTMEEQTQTETRVQNAEIAAELILTRPDRAPEVILQFNGLNPPNALFGALHGLGWTIPPVPPPPGAAIDWTPDPTTGADYTLKPWTVKEFRLDAAPWWTLETEKTVGAQTIAVLREHGVNISGVRGVTEAEEASSPASEAIETANSTSIIVIDQEDTGIDGFVSYDSFASRARTKWSWREFAAEPGTQVAAPEGLTENVWILNPDDRPATTGNKSALHMIALPEDSKQSDVEKVAKLLGAAASFRKLISLVGGADAVMITAVVPSHSSEMMISNVRLRFPKLICRGDVL